MKKIFYILFIITLLFTVNQNAFASSQTNVKKMNEGYLCTIKISPGWNLVPLDNVGTFKNLSDLATVATNSSFLKATFAYLPINKKYVEFHNGFDNKTLAEFQDNQKYLRVGAKWLYSTKDLEITYGVKNDALETFPGDLYAGWNLMAIPPQFFDKTYDWGNCKIEKLYIWDEVRQKWTSWPINSDPELIKLMEEISEGDFVGYGVAVNVRKNCSLGKTGNKNIITAPSMPE